MKNVQFVKIFAQVIKFQFIDYFIRFAVAAVYFLQNQLIYIFAGFNSIIVI